MSDEKREFTRFDYKVGSTHSAEDFFVSIPEPSDDPLYPEDFSTGALKST